MRLRPLIPVLLVLLGAVSLTAEQALPPQEAAEAEAVVEAHEEKTAEQVVSGEVTIAEATRDPTKAPDPGAGGLEWYFALIMGRFIFPLVAWVVNLIPAKIIANVDAHRANGAVCILLYLGLGYGLMADRMPELPQDWKTWLNWAFAASGVATLTATPKEMGTGTGGG